MYKEGGRGKVCSALAVPVSTADFCLELAFFLLLPAYQTNNLSRILIIIIPVVTLFLPGSNIRITGTTESRNLKKYR